MKYLFKFILLIALFFLLNKNVLGFEFVKSINNPLPITYINNYISPQQAGIFREGNLYKAVIAIHRPPETYHSLGYFESTDGINWTMKKEILSLGFDLSNPSVLKVQTGYKLFVTKYESNSVYKIYGSDCDFEFNCSANIFPIIIPDVSNISEKNGVFAGRAFQQNNRIYLFFGAWGGDGFKIKLAYSDDLTNWQRCSNGFLYGGDGPFPYQENNDLYLFFHRSDSTGIKVAKTTLPLDCNSTFIDQGYLLTKDKPYDQNHLIFPSIININGNLRLYYSGLGNDFNWKINLAEISIPTVTPTSTPTATPTSVPTPTSTLTPTPYTLRPIILIPGFLASWNKDSLIHNIYQPQSNWKINPIVHEYDGVINTLKNLGYEENINLFIFAYDWRKQVLEIVDDLHSYIQQLSINDQQSSIIGHSLGGLVSRIYIQKYNNPHIDKLITAGSPHRGATVAYKIVEAGEIERFNDYLWLAVKMISSLNKNNLETDKVTINRLIPVMSDLFPVYNFLKMSGDEINILDMKVKNKILPYYNEGLTNWTYLTNLTTIVGEKGNTLKGFNISNQTFIDKLLDNYPDGRPQSSFSEIGDYTVLPTSARINTPVILNFEHGELIYKEEAIKKILEKLEIQYNNSQVVEGKGTIVDSSLIFLIKSPATMEVVHDGQTYLEKDGLIFIENAQSGNYQLRVKGITSGNYEIVIGQIGKNNDVWDSIYGETMISRVDNYNILYNSVNPSRVKINDLLTYLNIKGYKIKNLKNMKNLLHYLIKEHDFIGLEKFENYQIDFINKNTSKINIKKIDKIEEKISRLKKPVDQVVLQEIVKRLDIIKNENIIYGNVLIESIEELLKIVKK